MIEAIQVQDFLPLYVGFALATAGSIYAGIVWFGRHLSQDARDSLTLWLWGDYDSTWSHHFCNLFDCVFGRHHWSWRCFVRSSIASVLAVVLLYILFAEILGVMGRRTLGNLSLWQAVLLGAAINIIPDYLSLFETRWLLKRFERVRSFAGQLGLLFVDALLTGAIIWFCINLFQAFRGDTALSAIEMLALFSVFSLFFYSTFLTSAWAWVYCLSTWFMRIFSRTALRNMFDVENKPVAQVALVSSALIFVAAILVTPVLKPGDSQQASRFDQLLCSVFGDTICLHVTHFTEDESQAFHALDTACAGLDGQGCYDKTVAFVGEHEFTVSALWSKACDGGYALGCNVLGWMHYSGQGQPQDYEKALPAFQLSCDGKHAQGCFNLAYLYEKGLGVVPDLAASVRLYQQACDLEQSQGCLRLGWMYQDGRGVALDLEKAASLFRAACNDDQSQGCVNLGHMYQTGSGVAQDDVQAELFFERACKMGQQMACAHSRAP